MALEPSQPSIRPQRPRSVTILAWLHLLQSLVLSGFAIYRGMTLGWTATAQPQTADQFLPLAVFEGMLSGAITLFLSVLGVGIAVALLRLRSWAWNAAMILQGLGLMAALFGYIRQHPNYVGMLAGVLLVLYLNQQEVRSAFQHRSSLSHPPVDG